MSDPSDADRRREFILKELKRTQMVKVSGLSERLGVSDVSIRRDLERLEYLGLLKRVHGGAVVCPHLGLGQSYSAKMRHHFEEKQRNRYIPKASKTTPLTFVNLQSCLYIL
jgi:DeoR/GlpR family transcriptional regulator of sugar metabolism